MADEKPAGGKKENVLTRKIGPLPTWGWIAIGGTGILIWAFFANRSAQNQSTQSGPQGNLTPPVVVQNFPPESEPPPPGPPTGHHRHKPPKGGDGDGDDGSGKDSDTKQITVTKNETLDDLAKYLHWSPSTLKQVEEMNAIQGQELKGSSKLHKGQTIIRPTK